MGYRYINKLATPENLNRFLEFVDLAAGAGTETANVWEIERRLVNSLPMQLCVKAILQEPASAQLVQERYVGLVPSKYCGVRLYPNAAQILGLDSL
jgi:hypothetical protein